MTGTGLFTYKTPHNQNIRRFRQGKVERTLNQFAELLAEHGNARQAAEEMGFTPPYGYYLLKQIKARCGWQAQ